MTRGTYCRACGGDGYVETGSCPACHGSGRDTGRIPRRAEVDLAQDTLHGRYYNANRYSTPEQALEQGTWYVAVMGYKEEPECEEMDIMARDRREAFAVAKAAMTRDYVDGLQITSMEMA